MRLFAIGLSAATFLSSPALAQFGNPGGMDPAAMASPPGSPPPQQTNPQDRLFIQLASAGGTGEVDLAKLAQQKAENARVKEFARRMVDDHTKANDQLANLARQAAIPVQNQPDPDQQAVRTALDGAAGAQFDRLYMQAQLIDHQKTVQLLQWVIGSGQNAALQRFAIETLPAVLQHLQIAQHIWGELTGAAPPATVGAGNFRH
jgi:putative membrane protein